MKQYTIEIELKSDTFIGSGEGFGATIDSDILFDDMGIPYIPAKRIKGCLKDSASQVCRMFKDSDIDLPKLLDKDNGIEAIDDFVNSVFGKSGSDRSAPIYFANLVIEEYDENYKWLQYLAQEYKFLVSRDTILPSFTMLRRQTAIGEETGIAKNNSLRTIRVIKKGLTFNGHISIADDSDNINLLALSCLNLKNIGTKRNRGFGNVECKLIDKQAVDITNNILKELSKCTD
jgi:CRISPR-associated protein Csx10